MKHRMGKRWLPMILAALCAWGAPLWAQGSGEVRGTATNVAAQPLADIEVSLYAQQNGVWRLVDFTFTEDDGAYAFPNVANGVYRMLLRDWSGVYAFQYYEGAARIEDGTDIQVDDDVTTIDPVLQLGGRIAGTATGPNGEPLSNLLAFVFPQDGDPSSVLFIGETDGVNFEFGGLPSGDYVIRLNGSLDGTHLQEYYQDAYTFGTATPIPVTQGFTTDNINVVLGEDFGGSISGTVRNGAGDALANIEVNLYESLDGVWRLQRYLNTDSHGEYAFAGLRSGEYRLQFVDRAQVYAFEFYDNATRLEDAQSVQISGSPVALPDVTLAEAGRIAGTLTDPSGAPLQNAFAFVFADGAEEGNPLFLSQANDGTYDIGGLPSGDYVLRFSGQQGANGYASYYDDKPDFATADRISVTAGQTTDNINAVLGFAIGGTVTGVVTDIYGRPFDFAIIGAYQFDGAQWNLVREVETQRYTDGEYSIDLPAGDYRFKFEVGSFYNPDFTIAEFYPNAATIENGKDVTVALDQTVTGIDGVLGDMANGAISGTVVDGGGTPLAGIEVYAYNSRFSPIYGQTAITDANGAFTVDRLPPDLFYLEFYDPNLVYETEFYDDAVSLETAASIQVDLGPVSGFDAALSAAGSPLLGGIAGTVVNENGAPVFGIRVTLLNSDGDFIKVAYTDTSGFYRLRNLDAGDYKLRFSGRDGFYVTEYYDDAPDLEEADIVTVADGALTTGVDAAVQSAGAISGEITKLLGGQFQTINAGAYRFENGEWVLVNSGGNAFATDYRISQLPPGTYRVQLSGRPNAGPSLVEWHDDATDVQSADDVTVVAGQTTTGISGALGDGPSGSIAGVVTDGQGAPLSGIQVNLYANDLSFPNREATTAADGAYVFPFLSNGVYYVQFVDPRGVYPGEFFDDAPDRFSAAPITVAGQPVGGIDAALDGAGGGPGGGAIAGVVTDANDAPLAGIQARCFTAEGEPVPDCQATTDAQGEYLLGGFLPTGDYLVLFRDPDGGYVSEYYDDVAMRDNATPVAVTIGATTAGIDATLAAAGLIAGRVADPDGEPYRVAVITAFQQDGVDWRPIANAFLVEETDYLLGGLPQGPTRVCFRVSRSLTLANGLEECYDDAPDVQSATDIQVPAGQTVTGIDAVIGSLAPGGISGTVTDANGAPLAGVAVTVIDDNGFPFNNQAVTDQNGQYLVDRLAAGAYVVRFDDPTGTYLDEIYDNVFSFDEATPVAVGASVVTGIDAALDAAGSISGTLLDANGAPFDFAEAIAYVDDGPGPYRPVARVFAGPDGTYRLDQLLPRTYRVAFIGFRLTANGIDVFSEVYDDAPTVPAGDGIVVADGAAITGIDAVLDSMAPPDTVLPLMVGVWPSISIREMVPMVNERR